MLVKDLKSLRKAGTLSFRKSNLVFIQIDNYIQSLNKTTSMNIFKIAKMRGRRIYEHYFKSVIKNLARACLCNCCNNSNGR